MSTSRAPLIALGLLVVACPYNPNDPGLDGHVTATTNGPGSSTSGRATSSQPTTSDATNGLTEGLTSDAGTTASPASSSGATSDDTTALTSDGATTADPTAGRPACGDGHIDPGEFCAQVPVTIVQVPREPVDLAIARLDDQPGLDLATVHRDGTVMVLSYAGDRSFSQLGVYTAALSACRIVAVDGNGDNDVDLVVGGSQLVTLNNDGHGQFARAESIGDDLALSGCGGLDVLNNNGGPMDVVYTGAYSFAYSPGLLGAEGWLFGQGSRLPVAGEGAFDVTAVEFTFDADNLPDVLAVNQYYGVVQMVRGDGTGQFVSAGNYDACSGLGYGARAVQAADLDGDGNEDMVTSCMEGNFTIALGNGDGTFAAPIEYLYAGAAHPTIADVNGDHAPDILMPSTSLERVNIYLNDGTLPQNDPIALDVSGPADFVRVRDIDGDGAVDIAVPVLADRPGVVEVFFAVP